MDGNEKAERKVVSYLVASFMMQRVPMDGKCLFLGSDLHAFDKFSS
jgi:hypothetical protein